MKNRKFALVSYLFIFQLTFNLWTTNIFCNPFGDASGTEITHFSFKLICKNFNNSSINAYFYDIYAISDADSIVHMHTKHI